MKSSLVLVATLIVLIGVAFLILRTSHSNDALRIEPKQTISASDLFVGSLVTWDDYVAWMGYSQLTDKDARILLYDLENKKTKTLAEAIAAIGPAWIRGK